MITMILNILRTPIFLFLVAALMVGSLLSFLSLWSKPLLENADGKDIFNVPVNIIGIILLFISFLYFVDVMIWFFRQRRECKTEPNCNKTFSFEEYTKHAIVIFFLAFALGLLGSLEVISEKIHSGVPVITNFDKLTDNIKACGKYKEFSSPDLWEEDKIKKSYLLECTRDQIGSLIKDDKKNEAIRLYAFYSVFQNVLIALIAIELTIAYFVSGHHKSKDLVTGLLIAAILDIISFVTLKTIVAQPSLPALEMPRYPDEIGYMLGILGLLSFISSFEAIHYSQIKVDHTLGRFTVLKQLAEIIKTKGERSRQKIEFILDAYGYKSKIKMLTCILTEKGYTVKCEMFHQLLDDVSFKKNLLDVFYITKKYNYKYSDEVKTIIEGCSNSKNPMEECIEKLNLELLSNANSNQEILMKLLKHKPSCDSFDQLMSCILHRIEFKIIKNVINNDSEEKNKNNEKKAELLNAEEIRLILEKAGFNSNRHGHEDTIDTILDYYLNSKLKENIKEDSEGSSETNS